MTIEASHTLQALKNDLNAIQGIMASPTLSAHLDLERAHAYVRALRAQITELIEADLRTPRTRRD